MIVELTCQILSYTCANCGYVFDVPMVPEMSYGPKLLRSRVPKSIRYINATTDVVFKDVCKIIDTMEDLDHLSKWEIADLKCEMFSYACDRDSDGSLFVIEGDPPCPRCDSTDMANWEGIEPLATVQLKVSSPSFQYWESLSSEARRELITSTVKKGLK